MLNRQSLGSLRETNVDKNSIQKKKCDVFHQHNENAFKLLKVH